MGKPTVTLESFTLPAPTKAPDPDALLAKLPELQEKCLPCEREAVLAATLGRYFPQFELLDALLIRRRARVTEKLGRVTVPCFCVAHVNATRACFVQPSWRGDGGIFESLGGLHAPRGGFTAREDAGTIHVIELPGKPTKGRRPRRRRRLLSPGRMNNLETMIPYLSNRARTRARAMLEAGVTPLVVWEVENWRGAQLPVDPLLLAAVGVNYFIIDQWNLTGSEEYLAREFSI